MDGVCSGIIQCSSAEECTDWLQGIASNISALTKHNVSSSAASLYRSIISVSCCWGWGGVGLRLGFETDPEPFALKSNEIDFLAIYL